MDSLKPEEYGNLESVALCKAVFDSELEERGESGSSEADVAIVGDVLEFSDTAVVTEYEKAEAISADCEAGWLATIKVFAGAVTEPVIVKTSVFVSMAVTSNVQVPVAVNVLV